MRGRENDLLHEESGESDSNADNAGDKPSVPVVSRTLLSYPLLVHVAVAGHVVECLVLQHVVTPAMFVVLRGVNARHFFFLRTNPYESHTITLNLAITSTTLNSNSYHILSH